MKQEETTRKTLRIEQSLEDESHAAINYYNLDDFHAYIRMLMRRDIKELKDEDLI
jgi:hypothetical protein